MSIKKTQSELFNLVKEDVNHQFQLLEQKIGSLIELTEGLKQEKMKLAKNVRAQEETLDTLSREVVSLRAEREEGEDRILTLIEKAEQMLPESNREEEKEGII